MQRKHDSVGQFESGCSCVSIPHVGYVRYIMYPLPPSPSLSLRLPSSSTVPSTCPSLHLTSSICHAHHTPRPPPNHPASSPRTNHHRYHHHHRRHLLVPGVARSTPPITAPPLHPTIPYTTLRSPGSLKEAWDPLGPGMRSSPPCPRAGRKETPPAWAA